MKLWQEPILASRRLRHIDWVEDDSLSAAETIAIFQGLMEVQQKPWYPNWWGRVTAGPQ